MTEKEPATDDHAIASASSGSRALAAPEMAAKRLQQILLQLSDGDTLARGPACEVGCRVKEFPSTPGVVARAMKVVGKPVHPPPGWSTTKPSYKVASANIDL